MPKQGIKLLEEQIKAIGTMLEKGMSAAAIGRELKVSKNTVCYYIKREGWRPLMSQKVPKHRPIITDQDFSILSDDILFSHDRTYVF